MANNKSNRKPLVPSGVWCITTVVVLFGYLGAVMGVPNMLNTIMKTAHDLLLNTVFYLMSICVITGAIGKVFVEFGVVALLERTLRPLMRPVFNLPGVTSLGAVMTFLSDNPAIISLAHDKRFASYFKKYQFISLTNFGTAFGMVCSSSCSWQAKVTMPPRSSDSSARASAASAPHASCSISC